MTPKLYAHPFSSYCWKALMAFYETGVAFELHSMEAPGAAERLHQLWPMDRFPVLELEGQVLMEASIIAEWADQRGTSGPPLMPTDPKLALEVRMLDRLFDNYVMTPMQTVVFNRRRPEGAQDDDGVAEAMQALERIYAWLDARLAGREWIVGDAFSLADCSAACSLFYADWLRPLGGRCALAAYLARLRSRASVRRCVDDARPWRPYFPGGVPAHAD